MTRFRSRRAFTATFSVSLLLLLAGCVTPSGEPVTAIAEPGIAAAFIPLHKTFRLGLERAAGAAVVIAPGVAVTNAHNANLVDPELEIGQAGDYDLLYFRDPRNAAPATAEPLVGGAVTAYGSDAQGGLRLAHGEVREVVACAGCVEPAFFTFSGNAGPGFSGGPVVDEAGRLVGIVFGYKDEGGKRLIYAYDMSRVRAEFSGLRSTAPAGGN